MRDLREVLLQARPSLAGEGDEALLELSYLVWMPAMGKQRHGADSSFCYFPARGLEAAFGRGQFNALNARHCLFEILEQAGRWARGYRLARDIQAAVSEYLRRVDESLPPLITRAGRQILTPPRAVASEDHRGRAPKAWANAHVSNNVPVDFQLLLTYDAHLQRYLRTGGRLVAGALVPFTEEELQTIEQRVYILARLIALANSNLGRRRCIPHRYEEAGCGRLYATGVNLQSAPREIRDAALHGSWDYDFSNCHYTIILQLALRHGLDLPEVRWYLDNKKAVRQAFAARVGTDEDTIKTCLLAPIYGARSTLWSGAEIPQLLGEDRARKLYADPQFRALKADVARARKVILRRADVRQGRLFNAVGSSIPVRETEGPRWGKRRKPAELFAHIVFGVEAQLLRVVVDAYTDDVLLLMHDGFVSRRQLEVNDLEDLIRQRTGFSMKLDEDPIEVPPEMSFENFLASKTLSAQDYPAVILHTMGLLVLLGVELG